MFKNKTIKRVIGIDAGTYHFSAVQMVRNADRFCIERIYSTRTRRTSDRPSAILKTLFDDHGFDRRAAIAAAMPYGTVFFRNLEISSDSPKNDPLDRSIIQNNFPIAASDIIWQVCDQHKSESNAKTMLVSAVSKPALQKRIELFEAANAYPRIMDAPIFALHAAVVENHPQIANDRAMLLYIDETYVTIAVSDQNHLVMIRDMPISDTLNGKDPQAMEQTLNRIAEELVLTYRHVFKTDPDTAVKIYWMKAYDVCDAAGERFAEKTTLQMVPVDPFTNVNRLSELKPDNSITLAEGLALRLLQPERFSGADFFKKKFDRFSSALDIKKEIKTYAALAASIVVVGIAGLFVQRWHLERQYGRLKQQINRLFSQTVPEEKNIVNPVIQLQQKIDQSQKSYRQLGFLDRTAGPLEVLYILSKTMPDDAAVALESFLMNQRKIYITANASSFHNAHQWREALAESQMLESVEIQDIKKQTDRSMVTFTMVMELR